MVSGQYGLANMGDDILERIVYNMLEKNPKQYEEAYQNVLNNKVNQHLREQITIDEKASTIEELDQILKDFQAEQEAKKMAALAAEVKQAEEE